MSDLLTVEIYCNPKYLLFDKIYIQVNFDTLVDDTTKAQE